MDTENLNFMGENIKMWRKALGLTQEQLAIKCCLAQTTITQVENGKRGLSLGSLKKVTKALDMPMSAVFEQNLHVKVIRPYDNKIRQKASVTKYVMTKSEFDKKELENELKKKLEKKNNKKELLELIKQLPVAILEHYLCLMKIEARSFKKKI